MAIRLGYAVHETGVNLRRNLTLTIATFVTVAVSLALSGAALNLRQGVQNATAQWRGGVEFIVFMNPDASQDQIDAVGRALDESPVVKDKRFVTKDEAYGEFQKLYPNSPELLQSLGKEGLPTSWRVVPDTDDATVIEAAGNQLRKAPGVFQVSFAADAVARFERFFGFLLLVFLSAAVALLAAASLLILNTIRLAMFARRREIEVMKLVGATNWFIRVPFMLEGLLQGVVGGLVAWFATWSINRLLVSWLSNGTEVDLLQSLALTSADVRATGILLVVIGAVVGTVGSGVAVTRFLDV